MAQGRVVIVLVAVLLGACAEPLPEDRLHYVGEWRGLGMVLLITADGSVAYERHKQGAKVSVNGPLQAFQGDDFTVGVAFITTTFDVSVSPRQVDGAWKMVVDGVELTRVR